MFLLKGSDNRIIDVTYYNKNAPYSIFCNLDTRIMDNYLIEIISRKDYISLSIAAAAVGLAAKYSYNIYSNSRQNYINKDGFKNIPSPPGSYPYIGTNPSKSHMLTLNICPGEQVKRWHEELGI
ncbi:hypothetical protein PHYBLDRAFT_173431 [Phycomyces blakesleeanus NRRL 1555(-)]|uniref:Uncharacterized protein n=1 Tax=Phycomyces blakesleeanus (strain ATCC 8743b / DSM 1359 / FGSC 10004 / NBRC 33097 / NRRL 1555) TaxID=763407 RepID=A0A167KMI5_PHYB8|nr:hypothetical protein PHYBLDRAFT_173431 [Phycomyces blakesleeanus NRRL 1555(-)]OAD68435.1 hypothetical protein PHYBLDRAFT_173431 [Phycomyces blakesleeanus NRRL 1555(-)]|eukprot:XP_018286475.1 hypothetical protein PHYBLDRAFT_173431 [Phycomyces blakesleeanus NRRL 1555(-)]